MEIKVPSIYAIKYNPLYLQDGTPIQWRRPEVNDHYFFALVREYGPNLLQIFNGHIFNTLHVDEVNAGVYEIIPLRGMEEGGKLIIHTLVFDVSKIPTGSIFVDSEGTSYMITEVDPYYLSIVAHDGDEHDIQAETFFTLDKEEMEDCRIILPPLYGDEHDPL